MSNRDNIVTTGNTPADEREYHGIVHKPLPWQPAPAIWPQPNPMEDLLRRAGVKEAIIQGASRTSDGSSTDYYKLPVGATDIIDLIEHRNMNFSIGNIFKACFRLNQKDGNDDLYDLRKIKFFVEREIARLEKLK